MILFFYGPNSYMARQQIARLTTDYVKKSGSNLGLERIDGAKTKPEEIQAALQATPFLANSRLVIVEDLGANKPIAPKVEKLLEGIPATTVAIFYDPHVDQRTTYFKTLKAAGKTVHFEALSTAKLHQWINREVEEQGGAIERPAIGRLLDLAGDDQWRLSNEIAKLAAYRNPITVAAVNEQVEESHTETIFTLVEAMTAGRADQALKRYHQLRSDGENEVYMLSMVIWQLRNLLVAKAAGKTTPPQLARDAKISPYVAGKALAKRHLFSEEQLKTAFIAAVDTDYQIKSGQTVADVAVEQLIYQVAGQVATTR